MKACAKHWYREREPVTALAKQYGQQKSFWRNEAEATGVQFVQKTEGPLLGGESILLGVPKVGENLTSWEKEAEGTVSHSSTTQHCLWEATEKISIWG